MSVLIKGMEMPKSCDECELCTCYVREDGTEENYRCVITFYPIHEFNERHEYCPLVEIPPHGRLIDADELFKEMERKGWFDNADRDIAEDLVLATPTIIEAEEGE